MLVHLQDGAFASRSRLCVEAVVDEGSKLRQAVKEHMRVIKVAEHLLECLIDLAVAALSTSAQECLLDE